MSNKAGTNRGFYERRWANIAIILVACIVFVGATAGGLWLLLGSGNGPSDLPANAVGQMQPADPNISGAEWPRQYVAPSALWQNGDKTYLDLTAVTSPSQSSDHAVEVARDSDGNWLGVTDCHTVIPTSMSNPDGRWASIYLVFKGDRNECRG
jgi:hypothetical protein